MIVFKWDTDLFIFFRRTSKHQPHFLETTSFSGDKITLIQLFHLGGKPSQIFQSCEPDNQFAFKTSYKALKSL
jgi:hypothetical protein